MAGSRQCIRQGQRGVSWLRDKGLIYLATPYSKFPGGQDIAFIEASKLAAELVRNGCSVYSPIAHTHPIAIYGGINPLDHELWIPFDRTMMEKSEMLLVAKMDSWQDSFGITYERKNFEEAGKPIYFIDPYTMSVDGI